MEHLSLARGGYRLMLDTVLGVNSIVENLHSTIANRVPLGAAISPATSGTPAYDTIRQVVRSVQDVVDGDSQHDACFTNSKARAAINGVCGDHLDRTNNPLALPMHVSTAEGILSLEEISTLKTASPHLVVMVHGLCMSHHYWTDASPSLGEVLENEDGYSVLYLSYNSGKHISTNGEDMAALLDEIVTHWPVAVETISMVGHSMGGLVIRSACHYAQQHDREWLNRLETAIYLGSPHHGSPLAKAGHWLTGLMSLSPYSKPFAVGRHLSDGTKDLRFGNLLHEDWQHDADDAFLLSDNRKPVPLVDHVDHFFAAAAVGDHALDAKSTFLGDLLVRLGSATGFHKQAHKKLDARHVNCRIFESRNHFDLINDPDVQTQIRDWLGHRHQTLRLPSRNH